MACLEKGELEFEGLAISTTDDLMSRLSFSKEGDHWESTATPGGDVVVAVDCTQDEAIISAGQSRELINAIQQLRKAMGLDLSDKVEVFFEENAGMTTVECAVSNNVKLFEAKLGAVPVPKKFAPSWSVVLRSETSDIGGSNVTVFICRPAVAGREQLSDEVRYFLSMLEPSNVFDQSTVSINVDGKEVELKQGEDFWVNTVTKLRATKALSWV